MTRHAPARHAALSMTQVLLCGAAIVTLSMGIRHGFGLWLQPITIDRGWSRETFAFALAVQNLAWGIAGAVRRRARRPLRRVPRPDRRQPALCARPGGHGAVDHRRSASSAAPAC